MAMNMRQKGPQAVSDLAVDVLDPLLRKRAGMSIGLVQSWDEIVGERLAVVSRPEKIVWPRRMHEDDPFEPAMLVIACEGASALRLQHETGEVISRVNAFLGFAAIGRIRIVQKPVAPAPKRKRTQRKLTAAEGSKLDAMLGGIEDDGLKQALARLGSAMLSEKR